MAIFLAIAFENNWIGEKGRVALGIVTGLVLIGISEYANRSYPMWARSVSGADYMKGNLLLDEVKAEDVAKAFFHLAVSKKTTGAVLTVDGGNIAASLR